MGKLRELDKRLGEYKKELEPRSIKGRKEFSKRVSKFWTGKKR